MLTRANRLEARVVPDRVRLTPLQLFQSTTYPVLAQIPVDIWLLIFDAGNFAPHHLEQISLTCRWFRALCIPRLYSSVIITRDKPAPGKEQERWDAVATGPEAPFRLRQRSRAEKFRGLKDAKHILPYVRRLEFRHYPLSPASQYISWIHITKPFQSRPTLVFLQQNWKEVFLDVAEALPEMVALEHIHLCYLDIPSRVSQVLKGLPSLRTIELIKCKLECTDWPRVPEIRIAISHNLPIDVSAYAIIDSTVVRSLDLPIAPTVSESRMPLFPHLMSLTVPMVTLEQPTLLNSLKEFLVATPSIQHLSLLGGLYQLRRPHSHRCYQQPKLELPPTALPNLRRIEAFCRIIDDLVPGRKVTDVNLWCWGSLEERIEGSYQIFKTSRAQSGVEKLALNFPNASPLNYTTLADVAPGLRSLEINHASPPHASAIIVRFSHVYSRLGTLILIYFYIPSAQTNPTAPSTCPSAHAHTASNDTRSGTVPVDEPGDPKRKGENETGAQVPHGARAHGLTNAVHDRPLDSHVHADGPVPDGIPSDAEGACEEAKE